MQTSCTVLLLTICLFNSSSPIVQTPKLVALLQQCCTSNRADMQLNVVSALGQLARDQEITAQAVMDAQGSPYPQFPIGRTIAQTCSLLSLVPLYTHNALTTWCYSALIIYYSAFICKVFLISFRIKPSCIMLVNKMLVNEIWERIVVKAYLGQLQLLAAAVESMMLLLVSPDRVPLQFSSSLSASVLLAVKVTSAGMFNMACSVSTSVPGLPLPCPGWLICSAAEPVDPG